MQYVKKEHPNAFEILKLDLKLSSQSYVEFDFKKHSKKTPCGWEINPLIDPTRVRNKIHKCQKSIHTRRLMIIASLLLHKES